MKKVLLTAFVMAAAVCTVFAQDQKAQATATPVALEADQQAAQSKKASEWKNTLVTELKLTEEQVQKITEMDKAFGERRKAIHNNTNLTDAEKEERKMALKKAREAQFLKLLTPEQQVRYKELLEAKK